MKKIVITGGAGFIGINLVNNLIKKKKYKIFVLDALKYSSNKSDIKKIKKKITFYKLDITDITKLKKVLNLIEPDIVFHLAAESHVDRSIDEPLNFINTNINGTYNLLQTLNKYYSTLTKRKKMNFKFIHISTDEVFGELGLTGKFNEKSNYKPNSPYSASKASSDMLVRSWFKTFKFPSIICNCSNNYGPYQHPEKLIPNVILRCMNKMPIEIYGKGNNKRDWLYVEDHINALYKVMLNGEIGHIYTIGTGKEYTNIEVISKIINFLKKNRVFLKKFGKFESKLTFVNDRLGHDFRYSIDSSKIKKKLRWNPVINFDKGLKKTINWYLSNNVWISEKLTEDYKIKRIGNKNIK